MPLPQLSDLHLGKVDGKHEFIDKDLTDAYFDAFLIPQTVDINALLSGHKYVIQGFRGTGKTSLLRYMAKHLRHQGAMGHFVLFKSNLTDAQRTEMSRMAGLSIAELDPGKLEIQQDFKDSWRWFLHKKIGEIALTNKKLCLSEESRHKYLEMLGLVEKPWFDRVLGGFPRIEGMKVKFKAKAPVVEAQLEGKLAHEQSAHPSVLFGELVQSLDDLLPKLKLTTRIFVFVDELEVFYQTPEQYSRDLRLVRDLIFAVDRMVTLAEENALGLQLCVAVRSEVLGALGAQGQEVTRIAHDRGVNVAWHFSKRSLQHPLFEMIRKKIWISEDAKCIPRCADPINEYFPTSVSGAPLDVYILDQSFYKPRDIVWRLTIAQQQYGLEPRFTEEMFKATEIDYSARLWEEIVYELGAMYSTEEIDIIEKLFAGQYAKFTVTEVRGRLSRLAKSNPIARDLEKRRGCDVILQDLYRLGAVGNVFRVENSLRNRWMFRGESTVLLDKDMELHVSLTKRLKPDRAWSKGSPQKQTPRKKQRGRGSSRSTADSRKIKN